MKRFFAFCTFAFICSITYGQEIYIGKIIRTVTPEISQPYLPDLVYGLGTTSKVFLLEINSEMVLGYDPLIIDNIEYSTGDDVEITGIATTYLDLWAYTRSYKH